MSATDALLEREREAERLAALVRDAAAGRGGVTVIEGPAGIGKTRLLRHAGSLAEAAGVTVLDASGSELEHEFGFGVVRQLLERAAAGQLEGAAALAAPALGLPAPPAADPPVAATPGAADARFAVLHGLYWLVANLAAERPLLLAVDDAQWADEPSLRFLAYLARRLRELPVALGVVARPPLPGEDRSVLEAIAAEAGAALAPAPLSAAGIAVLAARRFGVEAEPAFAAACLRATGGNALLVEEVLAELERPDAGAVETAGVERVGRRVARRLAALGEAAGPLAAAVAVLGDGCELPVAAALANLELETARGAAAELAAADLLEDSGALRFRHPLIRAAIAERVPAVDLGLAHARAARLLDERGAAPGAIASHLLAAPTAGEEWVPEALRAAARDASGQGAPELAAAYLRRALAEPPRDRTAVLLELGHAEHAAGAPDSASRLHEAWRATGEATIALELASMLAEQARWREAAMVARDAPAGTDRETALHLFALLGDCVRMDPSIEGDEPKRLQALAATLGGETAAERHVLAAAAVITPVDTAEEHARAAELARASRADVGRFPDTGVVSNLIRAGRLDAAQAAAETALDAARRGGFIQRHASILSMRGWIWLERGALAESRDDLEAVLALAPDVALPPPVTMAGAALLAVVLAEQGEFAHADALLDQHALAGDLPDYQVMNLVLYFRSRVRALQGRTDELREDTLAVGRRYARLGIVRAVPPWRSQAAILDQDETLAREELALAERWGTPLARGLALRGVGLVTNDVQILRDAVTELDASPNRLELARARVDLGAALRRSGRRADARGPLRQGMDGAHACGAKPLADHARTELLATGARPRRLALQGTEALTPSEKRIAALAARGLTNRQIAQELFVTTATVETHLRHAFRKLDVGSRGELAAALTRPA